MTNQEHNDTKLENLKKALTWIMVICISAMLILLILFQPDFFTFTP